MGDDSCRLQTAHHAEACNDLAATAVLSVVENKISSSNDLVKKAEYNLNIRNWKKRFPTTGYTKITNDAKIKEKDLFNKFDISEFLL